MPSIICTACATLVALASAAAESKESACKSDVQKLCRGVKPGGGRILHCLEEHRSQLSSACKAERVQARRKVEKVNDACQGDVRRLCPNVRAGEGRIAKCLAERASQVSQSCRAALKK